MSDTKQARPLALSTKNALEAIICPNGQRWIDQAIELRKYSADVHAALVANLAMQFLIPAGTDLGDGEKTTKAKFDKLGFISAMRSEPLCEQSNFKQSRLEPLGLVLSTPKMVKAMYT